MDLESILTKNKATLSEEEKEFLREHKSELTGGQIEEYKDILGGEEKEESKAPAPEGTVLAEDTEPKKEDSGEGEAAE